MTISSTTDDQQQSNTITSDNATVSSSQAKYTPKDEDQQNTQLTPSKEASKQTSTADNNSTLKTKQQKIKVHLVAVGSAPIIKKSKFLMNYNDKFAVTNTFLRKILKLQSSTSNSSVSSSSLFLYINAAFVPAPDELLGDLYDCFNVRGELVIHYSLQEAWG